MKRNRLKITAIAAYLLLCCIAATNAAPSYSVTDLGSLGGDYSVGLAINPAGLVTGYTTLASGATHGFLYSSGTMSDLGTLGGTESYGRAINASGKITGDSLLSGSSITSTDFSHAFLYSGGPTTDLGTLGGNRSSGYGINASGQMIGWSYIAGNVNTRAFLYSGGTMFNLGTTPSGDSIGRAINDAGKIVGGPYQWTPTVPNGTTGSWTPIPGINEAVGINNNGQIVGIAGDHAYIYDAGGLTDIGTVSTDVSRGLAINDLGQVVGSSTLAFIYSPGVRTNLNALIDPASGWSLTRATGINNNGWITGQGTIGGAEHAYLLIPVPEPSALLLFAVGCISFSGRRFNRQRICR